MSDEGDETGRIARLRVLARRARAEAEALADRARRNQGLLGRAMEALDRDAEIGGNILAGALAYRLFIFALPLSLFLISALGVLAHVFAFDVKTVAENLGLAGAVTSQVADTGKPSSTVWVALGSFVVLVYVTRVLFRTVVVVHALVWHNPVGMMKRDLGGLGYFGAAIFGQLVLVGVIGAVRVQSPVGGVLALGVFLLLDAGLWLMVSLHVPRVEELRWTDLVPGAVLYAVGVVGIQAFNTYILGILLASKASTYGNLGAAAAVLLSFFLLGRVMVGAAVLDATHAARRARADLDGHGPDNLGRQIRPGSSGP